MIGQNDSRLAISVKETAKLLGVSKDLVYEAIKKGEIPAVQIRRRILVPKLALEKMLQIERNS